MDLSFKERFIICEEASVSPIVDKMSREIAKQLLSKIRNEKRFIVDDKNYTMNKGMLNFDCRDFLKHMEWLKVIYVIYHLDSEEEYNICEKHGMFPRSGDYNGGNIKVYLALVNGEPSIQFIPSIRHEVKHIFQYDMGAKKNENFYDTVIDRYRNGETWEKCVAWALYLSFKTEQDAFISQFDAYLRSVGTSKKTLPKDDNNPYYQFDRAFEMVESLNIDEKRLKESFGLTLNQLYSILNAADERLFKKMSHVWAKYVYEEKKRKFAPSTAKMNFLLECYRQGITEESSDKTW